MSNTSLAVKAAPDLLAAPPQLRGPRTSRPWTDDEKTIALFMAPDANIVEIGEAIDRSPTAVEFYLSTQGLRAKPMPSLAVRGRGRPPLDAEAGKFSDEAHVAAIFRECRNGFVAPSPALRITGPVYAAIPTGGLRRLG